MRDIRQNQEWTVDDGTFRYRDAWMRGRGVLRWQAAGRLEVDLLVDRSVQRPPLFSEMVHGLIPANRYSSLRLELTDGRRAFIPAVPLANQFDLEAHGRLTVEAPRALFIERIKDPGALSRHLVSGQYQFVKTPVLPHAVTGSFSVADRVVEKTGSMRALQIETRFVNLLCRVKEEPYLEVTATMDRGRFTKENARRLPRAIRVALALLASQEVWLMESSVERGRCTYIEVAKKPTPVVLTFLSMFPELDMTVPAGLFWALVQRLVKPSKEQWIIERASEHMMAANQQPTWYGRKLMVGTWLEAALRSYYEKPLSRPNQSWTVEKGLKDFQEHYLGSAWKAVKNDVLRSFSRIRHSTAHPDWVPTPAERDNPATAQEMADLQLLSWFYGRMVLALAGVAGLKPEVPTF